MGRRSDDEALAAALTGVVLVVLLVVLALLVATLLEIGRVYAARARTSSPVARSLWLALAAFLALGTGATLAAAAWPDLTAAAVLAVAWGFLVFVITVLTLDHLGQRGDARATAALGRLEAHLAPFAPAPVAPGSPARTPHPWG